jgi:hypothetical protein
LQSHRRRLRADALLLFGGTLGRPARPFAQSLELARLRKHQQRRDRDSQKRGECRDRPDLLERARQR